MAVRAKWVKGVGFVQEEVSSGGDVVDLELGSGLSPHARASTTRTASETLTAASVGMTVISGSGTGLAGTLKFVLPDPAGVPLAVYGFRMIDARAHVITSSAPASVLAFVPPSGSFGAAGAGSLQQSAHVTMSAIVGSSAMFQSDGLRYLMYAASGSHIFA